MAESEIVDEFEYKGHNCVIVKMVLTTGTFHNGYIQVAESPEKVEKEMSEPVVKEGHEIDVSYSDFLGEIETNELTFSGKIKDRDEYFFGFDSGHAWNKKHPNSQTKESVEEKTKEMVDEFEEKDIFERVKSGRIENED